MDFDLERNLEDVGIDAFDFSLMNDDERREVLNDAGLDPNDYEDIEFEESFFSVVCPAGQRYQSLGA